MTPTQSRVHGFAAIFEPEPTAGWGFRGDPYVWRALAAQLAAVPRPLGDRGAIDLLHAAFRDLVGVGLEAYPALESLFRAEFDGGGISGGQISLRAWSTTLMPLLEQRLSATRHD